MHSFNTDDEALLCKRYTELAIKSLDAGYFIFTDFLGLSEQSAFSDAKPHFRGAKYEEFGGAPSTERVMIRFGDEDELGYSQPFPISVLKIEPKSQKYANKLSHRDFLGAILNLGIERSTLGDIAILDNVGYVFVKEEMASFIADGLSRVKNTDVTVSVIEKLPDAPLYRKEQRCIQLSGERIDAAISKVFGISRDDSLSLFKKRLVFVLGRLCENNSYTPKQNDVISVRGYGRFVYLGVIGTSKKGKLNVAVDVFV